MVQFSDVQALTAGVGTRWSAARITLPTDRPASWAVGQNAIGHRRWAQIAAPVSPLSQMGTPCWCR